MNERPTNIYNFFLLFFISTRFMWFNYYGTHIIHFFVNYILIAPNLAFKKKYTSDRTQKKKYIQQPKHTQSYNKNVNSKTRWTISSVRESQFSTSSMNGETKKKTKNKKLQKKIMIILPWKKWKKSRWSALTYHYPIRYRVRLLLFIIFVKVMASTQSHKLLMLPSKWTTECETKNRKKTFFFFFDRH